MKISSKSGLAVFLSQLKGFEIGKVRTELEQYQTDPEIAAEILWFAKMNNDISGKVMVDLGCGPGIFGIGALLLGAKKAVFVDIDEDVINIVKDNLKFAERKSRMKLDRKAEFIVEDVRKFDAKELVDVVMQNPPFGIKIRHADRLFLEKAVETAPVIYSLHKVESKDFIVRFCRKKGFKISHFWRFDFPLKITLPWHRKRIYRFDVGCWRLEKLIKK